MSCVCQPFLAYYGQSVANGHYNLLYSSIFGYVVVETPYSYCLAVVVVCAFHDMAVPQRVVGEDYSAFVDEWEQSVVDLAVCALVAVDEHEVELHAQLRGFLHGVADAKVDEVGHVGAMHSAE